MQNFLKTCPIRAYNNIGATYFPSLDSPVHRLLQPFPTLLLPGAIQVGAMLSMEDLMQFEFTPRGRLVSDSDFLADLQRVAKLIEPRRLTISAYKKWGNGSPGPFKRFGSWPKALEKAGLCPAPRDFARWARCRQFKVTRSSIPKAQGASTLGVQSNSSELGSKSPNGLIDRSTSRAG